MYKQILVFDVETTGLNHKLDQIIEFGGVLLNEKMEVIDEIATFIKCDTPLSAKIKEITNISDEMLVDGMEEEKLAIMLDELIKEDTLLIAYNIQFDIGFLISLLERFNLKFKNNPLLDCMVIYKERHPYPHRLLNAIETYDLPAVNSHRALDDAKATFLLLARMNNDEDVFKYINRISFNSKYGLSGYKLDYIEYYPHVYINSSNNPPKNIRTCPKCGQWLKKTNGVHGLFYLCRKCNHTESL